MSAPSTKNTFSAPEAPSTEMPPVMLSFWTPGMVLMSESNVRPRGRDR